MSKRGCMLLGKLLVLPTWLLMAGAQPILPKKHVWKYKCPTLEEWFLHSTPVCNILSGSLWQGIINVIIISFWVL